MRFLQIAGGVLALLLLICIVNVLRLPAAEPVMGASAELLQLDADAAARRLAGAVKIRTISYEDRARIERAPFRRLAEYLQDRFPRVHRTLKREAVGGYSLLYTWRGRDSAAKPMLLLAHMDVVPVEPGTEKAWTHEPFSGALVDGFVWGRGTLDDKASLIGLLEAIEQLLDKGFKPSRDIYLAFGHDEEISGEGGARRMAALLKQRGVMAEFSLDEGGVITSGIVAGVTRPVASISSAEKGYASFRLTTRDPGGHSSRPPPSTAIGRLTRAVGRLERRPFGPRLASPVTDMFDGLAPHLSGAQRFFIANRWLFGPLLKRRLTRDPTTNAMVRTTTAPTIFHAGIKDNVLPSEASAVVNFRTLPGQSTADVEKHIRRVIEDDRITLSLEAFASEPSPVSPVDTAPFQALAQATHEVFPEAIVTTGIVLGATDNRHYGEVRELRYNFNPITVTSEDLTRFHGTNERIAVADYVKLVQFYVQVLRHTAQ